MSASLKAGGGTGEPSRRASCRCGQLSIECDGVPVRVSVCHCLACQRRTGSAFAAQARFTDDKVRVSGISREWVRTADSGGLATYGFCPECGSTVFYRASLYPDLVAVPLGAFADPTFPAPNFSVHEERQHAWVEILGDIEHQQ